MTNRDRFSQIVNFLVNSLSIIVFIISIAIIFVIMFITLPDDVSIEDMIKQPENYTLIAMTVILNIQVKLLGSTITKNKYTQSNEYIFAEKVDGKTTGELLTNQNKFITFNANRTLSNREAARYEYLTDHGYTTIDEVRLAITQITPTKHEYLLNKKLDKWSKLTFELRDKYARYKKAPKVLKGYFKVKYVKTIIHPSFWNYISQSSFKKGKRVLESYKPANKIWTILQTILMSAITATLSIQTFDFAYDDTKLPVFIAMMSTLGINFFISIITNLVKLREIPAFVKTKFRELNAFRRSLNLADANYLEVAGLELTEQVMAERKAVQERARIKKEAKTAKMTEDTKIALAKESNRKVELEIRKLEAQNKKAELDNLRRENKAIDLALKIKGESK